VLGALNQREKEDSKVSFTPSGSSLSKISEEPNKKIIKKKSNSQMQGAKRKEKKKEKSPMVGMGAMGGVKNLNVSMGAPIYTNIAMQNIH
jgi:hypothetical protein